MDREHQAQSAGGRERSRLTQVVNLALYGAGIGLFVYLLETSGLTLGMIKDVGWGVPVALVALYGLVAAIDAGAWYVAARPAYRPSFHGLLVLRTGGEALTNGLPGGLVFGEAYKALMLRRWYGTSVSTSAPSLIALKFALGYSQALFVMAGLTLCFGLLRARSVDVFGLAGLEWISFAVICAMCLFMGFPLLLYARGQSFTGLVDALARLPFPRLAAWLTRRREAFVGLDRGCAQILGGERRRLLAVFGISLLRWLVSVAETVVILWAIGVDVNLETAFVIEAVGSAFRLVFFLVPSGIGGVDASIFALFSLYGLPSPAAGLFIVLKRLRELAWIGLGFALVAITRQARDAAPRVPSPAGAVPHVKL